MLAARWEPRDAVSGTLFAMFALMLVVDVRDSGMGVTMGAGSDVPVEMVGVGCWSRGSGVDEGTSTSVGGVSGGVADRPWASVLSSATTPVVLAMAVVRERVLYWWR